MKLNGKRALSLCMATVMLLVCAITGWTMPVTALTPEYGDVVLESTGTRPNLLNQTGAAATERIWRPIESISDPAAGAVTMEAGMGGLFWNMSFLETNTTYILTGRAKGGTPNFYFFKQVTQVNSTTGGYMTIKGVTEDAWVEFSYAFTTGDTRPNRESDWIWFGNGDGTTTAYFDDLCIVKADKIDLAISDFSWTGSQTKRSSKPGDVLQDFSVTVTNNGPEAVGFGAWLEVDICIDATNVIATLRHTNGLAVGESVTLHSTRETWTAVDGDHTLTAFVRTKRYLYEMVPTTADNQAYYNMHVSGTALTAPDIAADYGFTELTFNDEFNSISTFDTEATGKAGYKWYVTRPYGETAQVLDEDYSVENGVLRLHTEKTKWAYSIATIDIRKMVGFAFNKGYLEYRIRVPKVGDDGWDDKATWAGDANNGPVRNPGVWAYPTDTLWASLLDENNAVSVEMDWMEYYGNKYAYTFSTTLHERVSEWVTDEESGESAWTQTYHTTISDVAYDSIGSEEEFYTMSCLWDDGFVKMYLDGTLLHTLAYSENDYPSDRYSSANDQPRVGSMVEMDTQFLPVILGGSEQFQLEVDYVRIWQAPEDEAEESVEFTMENSHITLPLGGEQTIRAVDAEGNPIHGLTWSSSDTTVVSAYNGGFLNAIGEGTATVIATDANGRSALCTVTVDRYANIVQNGDFEGYVEQTNWWHLLWGNEQRDNKAAPANAQLETSGGNTYMKLFSQSTAYTRFYKSVPLKAGRTYTVQFRYKGKFTFRIYDQNNYIVDGTDQGQFKLDSAYWKTASYTFTVADEVTNNGNLTSATIGFLNTANEVGYVDDFTICEVAPANTITVQPTEGGTIAVSKTTGLTAGETVTVTVTPNSGYILKTGSLTYTTQDGYVRKILNNAESNGTIAGGSGNTFTMRVPVGATTVTAEFVSTAQNNYQFGTIAASVHTTDDEVDGIRFLNRLYIDGLDLSGDEITLVHNGVERTVKQIGVLMARGDRDTLTLDDYRAYVDKTSSEKVWHALSYKNTSSSLYIVEYTDQYLDFAISMTTSNPNREAFLVRDYTICGYIELDNGEVIYTQAMHDAVVHAVARKAALA